MGEREGAQRAGRGEGETEAALRGAGGRRGSGRLGLGWGSPRKCQGQAWAAPRQAGRRRSPFRSLPQQRGRGKGHASGVRSPGPRGPVKEEKRCVSTKLPRRLG